MSKKVKKVGTVWDTAISDAETKIREASERIARLKQSIKTFKLMRDDGEPFPSEKSEHTNP